MTVATKSNVGVIRMKRDVVQRFISFAVIAPLFLVTWYSWLMESLVFGAVTLDDISWLLVNSSGFMVLILGSVFMRGHNNRNVLIFDALFPMAYWSIYLNGAGWAVENNMPYIAMVMPFVLYSIGTFMLINRIPMENKFNYMFGKHVVPPIARCVKKLTGRDYTEPTHDYIIKSLDSKGTTNYQQYMVLVYVLSTILMLLAGVFYVSHAIYFEVPFVHNMTSEEAELLKTQIIDKYGFDVGYMLNTVMYDGLNTLWSLGIVYYVFSDYVKPDQIGPKQLQVKNLIGNGAKKLV